MPCPLLQGSIKVGGTCARRGLSNIRVSRPSLNHVSPRSVLCVHSLPQFLDLSQNSSASRSIQSKSRATLLTSPLRTHIFGLQRSPIMGWACDSCTFINTAAGSVCGMCSQPAATSPSSALAKWSCEACTFVNVGEAAVCEMCENDRPVTNQSSETPSVPGISQLGSSFRPLRAGVKVEEREAAHVKEPTPPSGIGMLEFESKEASNSANDSTNPKSRKRKAKEEDLVILSEGEEMPRMKVENKVSGEDSNNLLKKLHQERMSRTHSGASASGGSSSLLDKGVVSLSSLSKEQMAAHVLAEGTWLEKPSSELTILSYNVWFREDLELQSRLEAIGDTILQHRPHVVFFQEVTENIYNIFCRASWWKSYDCSVKPGPAATRAYYCLQLSKLPVVSFERNPFRNSVMGRELCSADLEVGGARLLVATTHLESPCPAPPTWNQMFSPERVVQAKEALATLNDSPNVIFGGDMNWDDKQDGPPPLPSGWFDAWVHLRPGQDGFTYDSKANLMLTGSRLRKRLDRIYCKFRDFEGISIEMVGTAPIPDLTYLKEKKVKGQVQMMKLPVFPSDHFGLILKVRRKCE